MSSELYIQKESSTEYSSFYTNNTQEVFLSPYLWWANRNTSRWFKENHYVTRLGVKIGITWQTSLSWFNNKTNYSKPASHFGNAFLNWKIKRYVPRSYGNKMKIWINTDMDQSELDHSLPYDLRLPPTNFQHSKKPTDTRQKKSARTFTEWFSRCFRFFLPDASCGAVWSNLQRIQEIVKGHNANGWTNGIDKFCRTNL